MNDTAMPADAARCNLTARLQVPLPPDEAFRLFTARGEQDWVPGWEPRFPVPVEDDTDPGTVFETGADDELTIWLVLDREPAHHIRYARVTPGARAGTVSVTLTAIMSPDAEVHSEVTVTYELTALHPTAIADLREFAADYPTFIKSWQDLITTWLQNRT